MKALNKKSFILRSIQNQCGTSKVLVVVPVTLNSEMDFYLRNGDFFYEMELQNSILFLIWNNILCKYQS